MKCILTAGPFRRL